MPRPPEARLITSMPELRAFPPGSLPTRCAALVDAEAPWPEGGGRRAAVMMLFIPPASGDTAARLVFIRRSAQIRSHRGQIGFAGGRADPDDASPAATARRELGEELGVDANQVVTFGGLPPIASLDGSEVHAVLGAAPFALTSLIPAPAEVELVFADPWPLYGAETAASREFRFNIMGLWRRSRVFTGGTCPVWGLTAHILSAAALTP